jgi:alkylation response protein AidB-like acyl-CoA dehydrogenase
VGTAPRPGPFLRRSEWLPAGGKYYISGVDEAEAVLVVARHVDAGGGQRALPAAQCGSGSPALAGVVW